MKGKEETLDEVEEKEVEIKLNEKEIKTILFWKYVCEQYKKEKFGVEEGRVYFCPLFWIALWEDFDNPPCAKIEAKLTDALEKINPKIRRKKEEFMKKEFKEEISGIG